MNEECSNCKFYLPSTWLGSYDGYCRRYPPVFQYAGDESEYHNQPRTNKSDWCGEYVREEQEECAKS